jgi:hypothetical protein
MVASLLCYSFEFKDYGSESVGTAGDSDTVILYPDKVAIQREDRHVPLNVSLGPATESRWHLNILA